MRTLLLQTMLELKLLARLRWPLLLPLPAAGWMLLQTASKDPDSAADINLYAVDAHAMIIIFVMAVPILLGVLLIRRDTLSSSYEWSLSLPMSNTVIIASKWIAGFLYSSLFTLSVQAVYLARAWHYEQTLYSSLKFMFHYSLVYEMAFAAAVALGLVLGALMPLRFSLPIAFCGWVFGSLFVPVFLEQAMQLHPLKAFSLNPLIYNSSSAMTGEGWYNSLALLEKVKLYPFVAAFSLFMLAAAAVLIAHARPVRRPKLPVVIMLLTLLLSGIAYIPYGKLWMDRYEQVDIMRASAPSATNLMLPHEPYAFRISSMKLDVKRHPDNKLEMTAVIGLPTNNGKLIPAAPKIEQVRPRVEGHVSFLLDPLLNVQKLEVNGAPVLWKRQGQLLSFESKALIEGGGDEHIIEIHYGGAINRWMPSYTKESYVAFAVGESVFLPGYFGWYPIPGGGGLYSDSDNLQPRGDTARYLRADFELTASGFPGPLYSTLQTAPDDSPGRRHFVQQNAEAPDLFGGDFITVQIENEPIAMITTKSREQAGKQFLQSLNKQRSFYESWAGKPLDSIRQIVYFPMGSLWNWMNAGYTTGNTIYISAQLYQGLDVHRTQAIMSHLLFGDSVGIYQHVNSWQDYKNPDESYSMVQEIRSLILSLEHLDSLTPEELAAASYSISIFDLSKPMTKMVKEAYLEGNSDLVKRVLRRFYDQGLQVKDYHEKTAFITQMMTYPVRYQIPKINWQTWLTVWNEEKGR